MPPHRERELRLARGHGGDRLGPHEQVLRGVRAQALLRGAAGRRPGRGAGDRAPEDSSSAAGAPVRRPSRERAALLGQPGEPRRLPRLLPAGRHLMGLGARRRRAPHARAQRVDHGQVLQERAVRRAAGRPPHRPGPGAGASRRQHRPKLLWCGTTAYPRMLDFAAFRSIADEVGAILAADIAHISGPRLRRACTRRPSASRTS